MKTSGGVVYRYELPLLAPFPRCHERLARGFIVAFQHNGQTRLGEVSDAAALCAGKTPAIIENELLEVTLGNKSRDYCAPVRWAVSSALSDLTFKRSVELNALLDASRPEFVDNALALHTEGYRCFKIKIGDDPIKQEINRLVELTKLLGKNISLRLDANRRLTLDSAVEYAQALKKTNIEYFEEPFSCLDTIEEFHRVTGRFVALDETILSENFDRWSTHKAVRSYVLKPSRIGSLGEVLRLIEYAGKNHRTFVISSTFETSIGLSALAKLASIGQSESVAMGLATGSYFAADLRSPPLRPFRGHFVSGPNFESAFSALDNNAGRFLRKLELQPASENCTA